MTFFHENCHPERSASVRAANARAKSRDLLLFIRLLIVKRVWAHPPIS